jgi:hypothetical protein
MNSLAQAVPTPDQDGDDEPESGPDPGRAAAQNEAAATLGQDAVDSAPAATAGEERARAEYDYEAAEDNEVSLREGMLHEIDLGRQMLTITGEIVTDIQRIDPDWWLVKNESGQSGLVPSNYLTLLEDDEGTAPSEPAAAAREPSPAPEAPGAFPGATATALYDYEAGEDNELSFPENAVITNVVCYIKPACVCAC